MEVLNNVEKISTAKLKTAVKLDWGDAKLRKHLETMPDVEKTKEKTRFTIS
ncbi:MAG: hypothetical protein HUK08_01505 [Bacteroidaceae bacterium]|nr:hypothetical protein [Bacteroidaceae bacterium]